MTEDIVRAVLVTWREDRALAAGLPSLNCPSGLTLDRAWALALAPKLRSAPEQAHLDGCAHCQRLVSTFAEHAPHPERSALLRWALGWCAEGDAEAPALRAHLVEVGCERCG